MAKLQLLKSLQVNMVVDIDGAVEIVGAVYAKLRRCVLLEINGASVGD